MARTVYASFGEYICFPCSELGRRGPSGLDKLFLETIACFLFFLATYATSENLYPMLAKSRFDQDIWMLASMSRD